MNNLIKFFAGVILVGATLLFFAFAIQNTEDVLVVILPNITGYVPLYLVVLGCFATGFLLAVITTRFEYIKAKFNLFKLAKKFKNRSKNKSKYTDE